MTSATFASGGRYPVIRTIAILYFIAAIVTWLVGIAWAIYEWSSGMGTTGYRVGYGFVILAGAFLAGLAMLAIAEVIKLVIDIEHNSRMIALREVPAAPEAAATPMSNGERMQWLKGDETAEGALMRGH